MRSRRRTGRWYRDADGPGRAGSRLRTGYWLRFRKWRKPQLVVRGYAGPGFRAVRPECERVAPTPASPAACPRGPTRPARSQIRSSGRRSGYASDGAARDAENGHVRDMPGCGGRGEARKSARICLSGGDGRRRGAGRRAGARPEVVRVAGAPSPLENRPALGWGYDLRPLSQCRSRRFANPAIRVVIRRLVRRSRGGAGGREKAVHWRRVLGPAVSWSRGRPPGGAAVVATGTPPPDGADGTGRVGQTRDRDFRRISHPHPERLK